MVEFSHICLILLGLQDGRSSFWTFGTQVWQLQDVYAWVTEVATTAAETWWLKTLSGEWCISGKQRIF